MARSLTSGAQAQLTARKVRPVFFVSMQFADQTIYAHTSIGTITFEGQAWLGVGTLGEISSVSEGGEVDAQGISIKLSGIDPNLLNEAINELNSGGIAQVFLGFLDLNGALVADPIPLFVGLMDAPEIDIDTDTATIAIAVENRLSDLNRARGGRYTDQDQRQRYPNDGSFQWVSYLQDQHFNWK
jgi:hypothetical protein